ncbi:uncharacterized protein LOC128389544 [Panonychus citri]|uniref:uncharacterized protein LOC128389544 n=1 Tax=Panonychus citri TaxID=50023 RepID=UPI002307D7F2|nr:uncharacterized protein LOC128389544 [Panonychus citri]
MDIGKNVVQGFKTKDYTGICHHFLRGQCKYGAGCVHKHVTPQELEVLDTEEVLVDTLERDIVREGCKLDVTVTSCLSPYSFYVVPAEDIIHQQSFDSRVGRNYKIKLKDVMFSLSSQNLRPYQHSQSTVPWK